MQIPARGPACSRPLYFPGRAASPRPGGSQVRLRTVMSLGNRWWWPVAIRTLLVLATLCYAIMFPGRESSGSDFGRILIGKASGSALRPAFGQPGGAILKLSRLSPVKKWPGSPISGPKALLRNIGSQAPPRFGSQPANTIGSPRTWPSGALLGTPRGGGRLQSLENIELESAKNVCFPILSGR